MSPNPQFSEDLVTITEEILNEKLFVCSEIGCLASCQMLLFIFYGNIRSSFIFWYRILRVIEWKYWEENGLTEPVIEKLFLLY